MLRLVFLLFLFVLLSEFDAGRAQKQAEIRLKPYQKRCLPGFAADPRPWTVCRKVPSILILNQPPVSLHCRSIFQIEPNNIVKWVTLVGNMNSRPFPFKDGLFQAPGLNGLSLQIMDTVRPLHDAYSGKAAVALLHPSGRLLQKGSEPGTCGAVFLHVRTRASISAEKEFSVR